jgi:hypothetical protein
VLDLVNSYEYRLGHECAFEGMFCLYFYRWGMLFIYIFIVPFPVMYGVLLLSLLK